MKIGHDTLVEAIAKRLEGSSDPSQVAREIAAYLLEEKRVAELEPLLRDIVDYRIKNGQVEAEVFTAHEITDEVVSDIKKILAEHYPNAGKIVVSPRLNPELVGGMRVVLPREQLDLSVRTKLSDFKRLTS